MGGNKVTRQVNRKGLSDVFASLHGVRAILGKNVSQQKRSNTINFWMLSSLCIFLFNLCPYKAFYLDFTFQKHFNP